MQVPAQAQSWQATGAAASRGDHDALAAVLGGSEESRREEALGTVFRTEDSDKAAVLQPPPGNGNMQNFVSPEVTQDLPGH